MHTQGYSNFFMGRQAYAEACAYRNLCIVYVSLLVAVRSPFRSMFSGNTSAFLNPLLYISSHLSTHHQAQLYLPTAALNKLCSRTLSSPTVPNSHPLPPHLFGGVSLCMYRRFSEALVSCIGCEDALGQRRGYFYSASRTFPLLETRRLDQTRNHFERWGVEEKEMG